MIQGMDGWAEAASAPMAAEGPVFATGPEVASGPAAGAAVLGLGGCLDYEVSWDAHALEDLAREHAVAPGDLERGDVIRSTRELICSILAFLRDGVGGERAVASLDTIEEVSSRFTRRVTVGGTNVRAALAMSRLGIPSTLHLVSIDDTFRRLLPPDVKHVCSGEGDSLNPHLIVQFPAGARIRVGDEVIVAPRANRLIYVCDEPNVQMRIDDGLGDMLADAQVFLVSGFNAMVSEEALRQRIASMADAIARLPDDAVVVFEDAGYHVPALSDVLIDGLVDSIDLYGMNEDELQGRIGRELDLEDPAAVAAALAEVADAIPGPTLMVHTSQWALAYGDDAARYAEALDGGIALAGTRYLVGDALDAAAYARTLELPRQPAGVRFAEAIEALLGDRVVCRATRVLETRTPTTIGLGDTFVGGAVAALVAPGRVAPGQVPPGASGPGYTAVAGQPTEAAR